MNFAAKTTLLFTMVLFLFVMSAPGFAETGLASQDSTAQQAPDITETQVIVWPEGSEWQLANTYTSGVSEYSLYYPKGQGEQNWEEMVTLEVMHGKKNIKMNLPGLARMTFLGTQKGSPDATWDILNKGYDDEAKQYPHIIYEIDCPDFLSKDPAQVQLWKLTSGKTSLFNLQYSYRGKEMPADKKEEILTMLKNSHIKAEKISAEKE
jgi:hypothetical protein